MLILKEGIPRLPDYQELLQSKLFKGMESFSNHFLAENQQTLSEYSRRVIRDPFHTWSRVWEYPFVYSHIRTDLGWERNASGRILDAGSGITFFPFLLTAEYPQVQVDCLDREAYLTSAFSGISSPGAEKVRFTEGELQALPYPDDSFDAVCCISVLEHTRNFQTVIQEFVRVLNPGGVLLLTFDISYDPQGDLPASKAEKLLQLLESEFGSGADTRSMEVEKALSQTDTISTRLIARVIPQICPWPVQPGIPGELELGHIPLLSFYCAVYKKP